MHPKQLISLVAILASATTLAAQTQPAGPDTEPMAVAEIAQSAAWTLRDNAMAILFRPDVSSADKKQIRDIMERAEATAETLAKQAGDQVVDPKITRADLAKLQQQYAEPVRKEYKTFIRSRGDLDWMSERAAGIQTIEDAAILKKNNTYLDIAKDAGLDEAHLKAIAKILDETRARVDKIHTQMRDTYDLYKDPKDRRKFIMLYDGLEVAEIADARGKIRSQLTAEQVAALEWSFLQEYKDIPDYAKLAFSSQEQTLKAPDDGNYALETYPDRKVLTTVTLKKGASLGFQKKDTTTKALVDQKTIDVPANTLVYWIKVEPDN